MSIEERPKASGCEAISLIETRLRSATSSTRRRSAASIVRLAMSRSATGMPSRLPNSSGTVITSSAR